ncbi:hypothetical protein Q3G72_026622 [Acer saccharum]|nr:hypothetical protein Q3G72_026622 [Acer saccharum]
MEHLGSMIEQLEIEKVAPEEEMPEEEKGGGSAKELEEVVIREEDPPKSVKIGSTLTFEHKAALQKVLLDYNDVFAWSHEEMPGILTSLAAHRLNVDPTLKPVKQKRRYFNPNRNAADASCLTLHPLHHCMWDANFGAVRWSTSAGRPAPLTGANRPVARRWSCAGVDQRRPPAPIAQYGAAGLALVAAPVVKRSSQNWLVRWSCAGPPAQVHQRTE